MFTVQSRRLRSQTGFTLIELMVVISIMALLAGAVVLNLGGQRAARNVVVAENDLVASLREAQSYTLSSRLTPSGQSPQYYLIKFDLSKPTQYTLEAIYNATSDPQLQDIETVNLPSPIQISSVVINQRPASPISQGLSGPSACGLVAFAVPFGKIFFNSGCQITNPPNINITDNNDDYGKIVNFVTNVACLGTDNPPACTLSDDSSMSVTLSDSAGSVSKTITVNGITGAMTFN